MLPARNGMRVARGEDKGFVTIKMPADGIMAA
jgi:hypothetical protein